MPHSDAQGKDQALAWYQQIQPAKVIDIGAGAGTYARVMRRAPRDETEDVTRFGQTDHRSITGRRPRWTGGHWTAIEAWEPYVNQYDLGHLYDRILIADARRLAWPEFRADLVIAGDVLEHMTRQQACKLLGRIQYAAANLIVSIPVLHLDQGDVNGNLYERHIDHWSYHEMLTQLGPGVRDTWHGDVLAYYWWSRDARNVEA